MNGAGGQAPQSSQLPHIAVVGGGIAGITAALRLADEGCRVSLFERRPFLGGRTFSFADRGGGSDFDNGQHAMLGCYDEALALLRRIGAEDRLYHQRGIEVELREAGRRARLAAGGTPAPLHLARALVSFSLLTPLERLQAARGAFAFVRRARRCPVEMAGETVEQALRQAGQSARIREVLWNPIALAALNDDPAIAAAPLFAEVVRRAFFGSAADAAIVLPAVPLSELIGQPAQEALRAAGVELHCGEAVREVLPDAAGRPRELRVSAGEEIRADAMIFALTPQQLARIPFGAASLAQRLDCASEALLATAPIVSTHVALPRVAELPAVTGLLGTTTQWVFNSDRIRRDREGAEGGLLSCVTSGARELDASDDAAICALVARELHELLPEVAGIDPARMHVVRERHATMAPTVAANRARPPVRSALPGVYLAGDWVDTGLPATIESAALSGRLAAEACLSARSTRVATQAA